ncbi:Checkpoint protein HUS1 [Orchesella cincta]|uniref:Checkpoint protein n=1 Tax=Orchesella cincta TaxID=48709 RepID=A0A1D2MDG1_ORCCI|nr:Checkpoint protein HUS1 [Orchesella cincta]
MKFRAKSVDLGFIRTFAQLLSALSRCSRNFVLRITPDKLIFVLSDKEAANAASSVSAWGEIPKDPYFSEYAMEGVSAEDNEIYLEISPEKIAGCLSTLRSSHSVAGLKIKLTKKFVPCLTFETEFQSINSTPTCVHDVPVVLVLRRMWSHYQDPDVPPFDISIGMPELKMVRLALDRMKNLGPRLTITANRRGRLSLSVDAYNVKCTVKFNDLRVYDINDGDVQESEEDTTQDPDLQFSVEVDMKTMIQMISSDLHKPTNFICSLCETRRLHLYFLYGDISLQYSIPSVGDHS